MSDHSKMREQMKSGAGFVAALDQSGGSTPKALSLYGVEPTDYEGDEAMFKAMHDMRARIILADDFTNAKIIGAILFERTMHDEINGTPVAELLWNSRGIVPFLKIDKGLEEQANGVQMLKPMPGLNEVLATAKGKGVFGTKERSVINEANAEGVAAIVAQQFEVAQTVLAAGLVPILEPEVNIHSETKAEAETLLEAEIAKHLDALDDGVDVMLKLTLPDQPGLYDGLAQHPRVLRVVALSGGYSTDVASAKLSENKHMIASFSRALSEGLNVKMTDAEFGAALGSNIDKIYQASI
ncbi:fructose bisphosphate aldolase [Roseobacter litoralis]|uniref:fructose-bisphosphate aldolase n=1 Tax=Roseobacter litoralis (strain ATCC 49566 / DSM 6996 / JCM 21268 / NBRC 15278 / OCh 149) TaxID=391595 RepID=F7ZAM7_ROSLO|nr:fructose bisphosphate aldolase [Roseobacter litoralis]AEI94223.1 fructose-bisphosphate aldolase class 1 [Roseobacter litoralis Och 149]